MEKSLVPFPKNAVNELRGIVFQFDSEFEPNKIQLIVSIEECNVNIREFGSYLRFIDNIYGRLTTDSLYRYAHNENMQLRISSFRLGSLDIEISKFVSDLQGSTALIMGWLTLKYLPNIIKTSSEAVKNFAAAYKDVQEAKLVRENRRKLRAEMKSDETIGQLDKDKIDQIVRFVDHIYAKETNNISAPIRFAQRFVKKVRLRIRDEAGLTEKELE